MQHVEYLEILLLHADMPMWLKHVEYLEILLLHADTLMWLKHVEHLFCKYRYISSILNIINIFNIIE